MELQFSTSTQLLIRYQIPLNHEACMLGLGGGAPDPYAGKDILMSGGRCTLEPTSTRSSYTLEARLTN